MNPLFTLEKTPSKFIDSYMWADYIELLCIVNIDGEISMATFIDRVRERDPLDEAEEFEAPEHNDKWTLRGEDWFRHLLFRQATFEDFYPFQISDDGKVLTLIHNLSQKQMLYVYLLMSSNLGYCENSKGSRNTLADDFEQLSYFALKRWLPNWNVFVFGKGSFTDTRYRGNIWTKVNALAKDLNEAVKAKQEDFAPTDTGDLGLDLVGWLPIDNIAPGMFIIFGQCACTDDWINKQYTATITHWRNTLTLHVDIHSVTFIPICFRSVSGNWHASHRVSTILIDRVRFVKLIQEDHLQFLTLSSYNLVERLLREKEELF